MPDGCPDPATGRDPHDQADGYEDVAIAVPGLDHPFNALKAHSMQLGALVGVALGVLALTDLDLVVDAGAVATSLDSVALSALGVLAFVADLAMGLWRLPSDPDACARKVGPRVTVAIVQIRRKPHYFGSVLVGSWMLAGLVAGWML